MQISHLEQIGTISKVQILELQSQRSVECCPASACSRMKFPRCNVWIHRSALATSYAWRVELAAQWSHPIPRRELRWSEDKGPTSKKSLWATLWATTSPLSVQSHSDQSWVEQGAWESNTVISHSQPSLRSSISMDKVRHLMSQASTESLSR